MLHHGLPPKTDRTGSTDGIHKSKKIIANKMISQWTNTEIPTKISYTFKKKLKNAPSVQIRFKIELLTPKTEVKHAPQNQIQILHNMLRRLRSKAVTKGECLEIAILKMKGKIARNLEKPALRRLRDCNKCAIADYTHIYRRKAQGIPAKRFVVYPETLDLTDRIAQ